MEKTNTALLCSHCGDPCPNDKIVPGESHFCCEGCRLVYQLLDRKGLCTYYALNEYPGVSLRNPVRKDKFAFLEQESMADALVSFRGRNRCMQTPVDLVSEHYYKDELAYQQVIDGTRKANALSGKVGLTLTRGACVSSCRRRCTTGRCIPGRLAAAVLDCAWGDERVFRGASPVPFGECAGWPGGAAVPRVGCADRSGRTAFPYAFEGGYHTAVDRARPREILFVGHG